MKSPPQVHTDLAGNEPPAFPSFRRNLLQRAEEGRSKQTSRSDRSNRGTLQQATDDLPSRPPSPASVIFVGLVPFSIRMGQARGVQIVVALVAIGAPLAEPRLTLPILLVSDRSASALKKWRLPAFPFVTSQLRDEQRGRNPSAGPVVAPD